MQGWRNKLAHYTKQYEKNPDDSFTFVLYHPIIKNQIKLSDYTMKEILLDAEKCKSEFYEILSQILKRNHNLV